MKELLQERPDKPDFIPFMLVIFAAAPYFLIYEIKRQFFDSILVLCPLTFSFL